MRSSLALAKENHTANFTASTSIEPLQKGNYTKQKKAMIRALLGADFVITDRRYIGHEDDTGFHHYAIDVAKHYGMED